MDTLGKLAVLAALALLLGNCTAVAWEPPAVAFEAEVDVGLFYDALTGYGDWLWLEPYGWISRHTRRASRLRERKFSHSVIVAVPRPPPPLSTHDILSETKITRSPLARRAFNSRSGAEQFVPPLGRLARSFAFVITESRGFRVQGTT